MVNYTEKWKKGELNRNKLYYYETPFMTTDSASGFWLSNTLDKEKDKVKILSEVPSYEQWQSLNELLDSMQDTNKALAHKLNNIKVNGNYPDRISKLKSRIKGLMEKNEKLEELLKECSLLLIKQQANDEVEHKESVELVLRIEEVLK